MEKADQLFVTRRVGARHERFEPQVAVAPARGPGPQQFSCVVEIVAGELRTELVDTAQELTQPLRDVEPEPLLRFVRCDVGQRRVEHRKSVGETGGLRVDCDRRIERDAQRGRP